MDASVGSVGDFYDNALVETINGLYKTEVIRRRGPWKNIEEVEYATLEWMDWFNNRRLLEPIVNVPPTEYEMMYYRQLEIQPWWLDSNNRVSGIPGAIQTIDGDYNNVQSKFSQGGFGQMGLWNSRKIPMR